MAAVACVRAAMSGETWALAASGPGVAIPHGLCKFVEPTRFRRGKVAWV